MFFGKKLTEALRVLKESTTGTVFTQPDVQLVIGDERYVADITYVCDFEYDAEPAEPRTRDYPGSPGGIVDIYPIPDTITIDEIIQMTGPDGQPMHPPTEGDQEAWGMVLNAARRAFNPEWPNFIEAASESAMEYENDRQYQYADEMYDRWKDNR